jgi:hypothetical protein
MTTKNKKSTTAKGKVERFKLNVKIRDLGVKGADRNIKGGATKHIANIKWVP